MTVKVGELMTADVVTTSPDESVGDVRDRLMKHGIHAMPIVDAQGHAVGIVTSTDLIPQVDDARPVLDIASHEVRVIPEYSLASDAARAMIKQRIHHLVVTKEKVVIGVISSFDLLSLIEGRKFVAKSPSNVKKQRRYVKKDGRWMSNPETSVDRRKKSRDDPS